MNKIMAKSLRYHNYLNAKRKADIEDGFCWSRTEIPFPKYEKPARIKWSVGLLNFCRSFLP